MSTRSLTTPFLVTERAPDPGRPRHWAAPGLVAPQKRPLPERIARSLRAAWRRHRTRQLLVGLDAHLLKDIGVSRAEADCECNKPFWQV